MVQDLVRSKEFKDFKTLPNGFCFIINSTYLFKIGGRIAEVDSVCERHQITTVGRQRGQVASAGHVLLLWKLT